MRSSARGLPFLLAALAASCGGDEAAPPAGPPSVILVTLDTTRADRLGCYGATDARTPNLDRLARDGVRFETAVTPVPQTLPAHCTIMTGRTPPGHAVRVNGARLSDDLATLAEAFAARGYDTAAFVGATVVSPSTGLQQGFAAYDAQMSAGGPGPSTAERPAGAVVAALESWLARRAAGRPAFVWLHFYDPHAPFLPPEPFRTEFAGRPYDGEVAAMDEAIGRALSALEHAGLMGSAVVAVAGDHGEGLGEHGEATHSVLLYDSTVRVPLLLWSPARWKPAVVTGIARLQDLAPTLLEAAGLPALEGAEGESLVGALAAGRIEPPRVAYLESLYPYEAFRWSWLRGLRTEEWKYIESVRSELYRVVEDPHEASDLLASEPARGESLAQLLEQVADAAAEAGAGLTANIDPNAQESLRALGYTAGSGSGVPAERPPRDPKDFVHLVPLLDRAKEAGFQHRDLAGAIAQLRALEPQDPTNPEIPMYLGLFSQRLGDNAGAEKHLGRALELDPKQPWALLLFGIVAGERQDYAQAEARFRRGLELAPGYAQLKTNLAILLAGTGRVAEGAALAREATRDDPALFDAWDVLGDILAGDPHARDEALAAWERAAALQPATPGMAAKIAALRATPR